MLFLIEGNKQQINWRDYW